MNTRTTGFPASLKSDELNQIDMRGLLASLIHSDGRLRIRSLAHSVDTIDVTKAETMMGSSLTSQTMLVAFWLCMVLRHCGLLTTTIGALVFVAASKCTITEDHVSTSPTTSMF